MECELADVMIFFSGASEVPHLGFEKLPTLTFHPGLLATASTCEIQLHLPLGHESYKQFKEYMILSIKGNDGFGLV